MAGSLKFNVKEYQATACDGQPLQLFRIGYQGDPNGFAGQPVVITTEFGSDCEEYLLNGANSALQVLKDSGNFDLWCANFRGTKYSPDDKEYLLDDIINNDFKAFTDAVLAERTEYNQVHLIARGVGATMALAAAAKDNEYFS